MNEDIVMRSIFLTMDENNALREFARETGCSVNDLIRAAVASKLLEWRTDTTTLMSDLRRVTPTRDIRDAVLKKHEQQSRIAQAVALLDKVRVLLNDFVDAPPKRD
jgi:hypothetical protein